MRRHGWPDWVRLSDVFDLCRLAGPVAVSRASMMLMGLTDTIILARNAPGELPYVLMAWFPISIFMGISMGLLLGVSILTAELSGRGDRINSGRVFRRGLWISLLFGGAGTVLIFLLSGPLFRAFGFQGDLLSGTVSATNILALGLMGHLFSNSAGSYLEALRRPTIVTIAMYFGVTLNLLFDLAFVAGWWGLPQMGADGVAIATSGTRWFLTIILLILVVAYTPGFKRSAPAPEGEAKRQLEVGYGMAASSVAEWGAFNFTFVIATWVSRVSGTVYGMVVHVLGFVFMGFLGIGTATNVRVAEAIGRMDFEQAYTNARQGVVATIFLGALAGLGMYVFADQIGRIFINMDEEEGTPALHALLVPMIMLASSVVIFDGLQNVASMASRALGSIWPPSLIHIGCYIFLMLPLAALFGLYLQRGVQGVIEGVILASSLAGVLQVLYLEYFIRRHRYRISSSRADR